MSWLSGTICVALTVVFLLAAVVAGRRGRPRAAMRWFGLGLLPVGVWLAGLVTAVRKIGTAIGDWAAHVVFDPRVWAGVILLGVGLLVLLASGLRRGRGRDRGGEDGRRAVTSPPSRPGATAGTSAAQPKSAPAKAVEKRKGGGGTGDDEFKEIEEILKRRGI
ncbi:hypothetical protein [Phaeacidiphilus oryzae]|uniref:hypothetical protein n=1 Tax=Phaeacidiphilus oryzae TaxID=348818 RepID=UPI0005627828|nr:hypothetical protein [Phaeacidiphilus oryzae]